MAILCTPEDLATEISCLDKQSEQTLLAQIVFLLCEYNGMACDPDTLAENPTIACLSNWDQKSLWAAAVFQLCEINDGGGGGNPPPPPPGTDYQQVYQNDGDPNGVVTVTSILTCICLDISVGGPTSGQIWWKTDGALDSNNWV